MEKVQMYEMLNQNIQAMDYVEKQIAMLQLAMYEKRVQEIKERKISEIRNFFELQSKLYNQKVEKYETEIENNVEMYKKQLERLIVAYNNAYVDTFKMMQEAMNDQKFAIANIITLSKKLQSDGITDVEKSNIQNKIKADVQKKLNFSVIIDECKARMSWYIENVQADLNNLFVVSSNQLQAYDENIFTKIRRIVSNKLSGKSKFKNFLENYEKENIRSIEVKNNIKMLDLYVILKGVKKQVAYVRNEIEMQYSQMIRV